MASNRLIIIIFILINIPDIANAQSFTKCISLKNVTVSGVITVGTYSQLVHSLGTPNSSFIADLPSLYTKYQKVKDSSTFRQPMRLERLIYDAYEYIRIGDSVQLVFVDLQKSNAEICFDSISLNKRTTQKYFFDQLLKRKWINKKNDCDYDSSNIGYIESHYYTYTKVKNIAIDFKEDPHSSVMFTFYNYAFNKRIWWIEFPIMRIYDIH